MSDDYLTYCFRQELGMTPIAYLNRYRVTQAKRLLKETDKTITEIALDVGFSDSGYFSRVFRRGGWHVARCVSPHSRDLSLNTPCWFCTPVSSEPTATRTVAFFISLICPPISRFSPSPNSCNSVQ